MKLVMQYTVLGVILGVSLGFLYGFGLGGGYDEIRIYGVKGLVIGLAGGLILGILINNFGPPRIRFDYERRVTYKLANCAWCRGKGRKWLFFPCPVCDGRGSVLAPNPHHKCGWCAGKGKIFLFLRCHVCDGTGWAYCCADNKKGSNLVPFKR